MTIEELIEKVGGALILRDQIILLHFPGPPEAPENGLTIPLDDLGYNEQQGVFRLSIRPDKENLLEQ